MSMKKSKCHIYPLKLKFHAKAWCLEGYCLDKNAYRLFKINRIANLVNSKITFNAMDLPKKETTNGTDLKEDLLSLELRFNKAVAHRLYDDFDSEDILKADNNTYLLKVCVPETPCVYSYILSFGGDFTIISPNHLKAKVKSMVQKVYEKYWLNMSYCCHIRYVKITYRSNCWGEYYVRNSRKSDHY